MNQKTFNWLAWGLVVEAVLVSIVSWGSRLEWDFGSLNAYQWFPLFGLLAWTVMTTHYFTGFLRLRYPKLVKPRYFSAVTGYIVLASLLLHPGILALEQSKNDQGTPPQSFINYVGEDLKLAVMLGSISLLIFLSFEVFNRLKNKPAIKKLWTTVSISQSLAMVLIFVHGLRLGSDLGDGWFRVVWILYGLALIPCFYAIHKADFSKST